MRRCMLACNCPETVMKKLLAPFAALFALAAPSLSNAEDMHADMHSDMQCSHADAHASGLTQPGQAAFAALQEAVALLEADSATDWSKVNITSLRDHLVDMDEVVMHADAKIDDTADGVRVSFTGAGRTLAAVKRMIPAHASMMNGYHDWASSTSASTTGVVWTIVASPAERVRIKALGPFGLLTLGSHHAIHHLALARGQMPHH